MKKIITYALMLLMVLGLVACGEKPDKGNGGGDAITEDLTVEGFTVEAGKKVYVTTIGQSDFDTVINILVRAGKEDTVNEQLLKASDVEAGSTVILVTGSSTKGLGSAGTDIGAENGRATEFALAAQADKIKLVVVHVGGEQRRGAQADPIIRTVTPEADLVMVVSTGNADGLFTTLTKEKNIPLYAYSRATKMVDSFKAILGL